MRGREQNTGVVPEQIALTPQPGSPLSLATASPASGRAGEQNTIAGTTAQAMQRFYPRGRGAPVDIDDAEEAEEE